MIVQIRVTRHRNFRKIGDDVHSTEWLSISEAALGTTRRVKTIWGEKDLRVPEGSQDGSTLSLKGEVILD